MKRTFRELNILISFVSSGCMGYVQMLNIALKKILKNWINELADIHYKENPERWKKNSYSIGNQRIIHTK